MKAKYITCLLISFSMYAFSQFTNPKAERHEFVARVDGPDEMSFGDYVVVGAFNGEKNAEHYTKELKKAGFPEANYGYLKNKKAWYVYFGSAEDIEAAKQSRDKLRERGEMFKNSWLLTVHK